MIVYLNNEKVVEFDNTDDMSVEAIRSTLVGNGYDAISSANFTLSEEGQRLDFYASAKKLG